MFWEVDSNEHIFAWLFDTDDMGDANVLKLCQLQQYISNKYIID